MPKGQVNLLRLFRESVLYSATRETHASEKDPVTKLCVKDDFPTALKPRMAILRWTRLGSLFGILPVRILFVSLVTWLQCQCQCPESKMLYQFFEKVPATTN